jgi:hypothetical protein
MKRLAILAALVASHIFCAFLVIRAHRNIDPQVDWYYTACEFKELHRQQTVRLVKEERKNEALRIQLAEAKPEPFKVVSR